MTQRSRSGRCRRSRTRGPRERWLRFAHWLVVANAPARRRHRRDTLSPSWGELCKLATIAVARTFLTYFLDRDVERACEIQQWERAAG